mmetsp:Transcript_28412/g.32476  ORF Transcript_28412/g.32476 Transcript_28412/m.32476 type:complete len:94 (-) Transcript_28412:342-623(-)
MEYVPTVKIIDPNEANLVNFNAPNIYFVLPNNIPAAPNKPAPFIQRLPPLPEGEPPEEKYDREPIWTLDSTFGRCRNSNVRDVDNENVVLCFP